jgi:hypothetical protein
MTLALLAGAALLFAAACLAYFHGRFLAASALGAAYWTAAGAVLFRELPPWGAAAALVPLAALPAFLLAVHAVDIRKGIFLLPTVYAIPLAFLAGALLWLVAAAAAVLGL